MSDKEKTKLNGNAILKCIIIIAVVIVVCLGIIIFLWKNIHLFGMGSGKGFVGGVNNTSTSNSMNNDDNSLMSQQEITTVHIKPVEQITVSRNMYLYKNKEIELKELINELKSLNEIEIEINPEANVSPNAMDKLTKALDENNLKYKVIE